MSTKEQSTIQGIVTRPKRLYHYNRNTFIKLLLLFQTVAIILCNIAMFTNYWTYDDISEFNQGIWTMQECPTYNLDQCVVVMPGEDGIVTTLRAFIAISYGTQIIAYLHTMLQFIKTSWYTYVQAIISVCILAVTVASLGVGFVMYVHRSMMANFALHIRLGFSANCAIANEVILMMVLAVVAIEISRRLPHLDDPNQKSVREMRHLALPGPPPQRSRYPAFTEVGMGQTAALRAAQRFKTGVKKIGAGRVDRKNRKKKKNPS